MSARTVVLDQATADWLAWRRAGIGSSDIGVLMGVSPWATPLELYRIKRGEGTEAVSNAAMERGRTWEPKARAAYELMTGHEAPPIVMEHSEVPWIRASLDGWVESTSTVLEIKVPGEDDHNTALAGRVPDKYRPQVQWQLMLTGALRGHYFSYHPERGHALVEVAPDTAYHNLLFDRAHDFWHKHVLPGVPPPLSERDTLDLSGDTTWQVLAGTLLQFKLELDRAEAAFEEQKARVVALMPHARVECRGVRLAQYEVAGRVDYARVPSLAGVDLEAYRKPATTAVRITWPKD